MLLKDATLNLAYVRHLVILFTTVAAPLVLPLDIVFFLQVIVAVYLVFYVVKNGQNLDLFDAGVLLFSFYTILITAARGGLSGGILYSLIVIAVLAIYIKHELQESNEVLKSAYVLHAILLIINFITMFFPTRDSVGAAHYLFGGKNALAILIVPTMFYIAYYSRVVYHRLTFKNILLIAISVLTLFMGDSSTAVVIAIIALLSVLFIHRVRLGHYFYLTVFTIFQFFIISAQRLSEIPLVADFITNYLGKDLTFSGRSNVWEVTMNAINSSFFGYGRGNSVVSSQIIGLSESHNMILEILLTGGVILLILFIVVVVTAFGFQKTKANVDLYRLSAFFVFLYFILGLTESVPFKIDLWIMLAVIVSTNSILSNRLRDAKV